MNSSIDLFTTSASPCLFQPLNHPFHGMYFLLFGFHFQLKYFLNQINRVLVHATYCLSRLWNHLAMFCRLRSI